MSVIARPALTAALLLATGCTTGWSRQDVVLPLEVPAEYSADAASQNAVAVTSTDPWWTLFGDASLNAAVADTQGGNLSLQAAIQRVRQAQAAVTGTRGNRFPTLDASASAGRARTLTPPNGAAQTGQFSASLTAGYELDVWGRLAAARDAAELDAIATQVDADAIGVSLTAQAVEAWLDGVYARAKRALLQHQATTQQEFLQVLLLRMTAATSTALDIEQQRQQVQALEAQIALLQGQEEMAGYRLSALQGRMPRADATGTVSQLPAVPPAPAIGIPADLLERRADVASARVRAEAADARRAQAVAARLPSLRLSGSLSLQSTSFIDLFDHLLWSLIGSITGPLLDGGQRRAEVERASASFDENVLNYAESIVNAAMEVENALALERAQRAYVVELNAQLLTAERALDLAREQYREGVIDYLRVLSAITTAQRLEQSELDAHRQLLSYRVQLHRALGGGWNASATEPQ